MKQYGILIVAAGILVTGFFVAGAFGNPSQNPPGGNVSAPVTVGGSQTITGLKTFNPPNSSVPFVIDPSKTGTVQGLNVQKVSGHEAKDLALGTMAGTVRTVNSFIWGVGCTTTSCSAISPAYCKETTGFFASNNFSPACPPGWNLKLVSQQISSVFGTCADAGATFTCEKPFPGYCGNGIVEQGEVCDDGNWVDDAGNCSANCQKFNVFSGPAHACTSSILNVGSSSYPLSPDGATLNKYCQEQGFASAAHNVAWQTQCQGFCPFWVFPRSSYAGNAWTCTTNPSQVAKVWCSGTPPPPPPPPPPQFEPDF